MRLLASPLSHFSSPAVSRELLCSFPPGPPLTASSHPRPRPVHLDPWTSTLINTNNNHHPSSPLCRAAPPSSQGPGLLHDNDMPTCSTVRVVLGHGVDCGTSPCTVEDITQCAHTTIHPANFAVYTRKHLLLLVARRWCIPVTPAPSDKSSKIREMHHCLIVRDMQCDTSSSP